MCTGLRHDDGSLVLVDGKMDPGRHLSSSETPHGIGPILALLATVGSTTFPIAYSIRHTRR